MNMSLTEGRRGGDWRGFTLVELLVVIGIIAVLMGILLPVMTKVRVQAMRTACGAQLRDIGNTFQMYMNENKGRIPGLNPLPGYKTASGNPFIPDDKAKLLWDVFQPYLKTNLSNDPADPNYYRKSKRNIWQCPADKLLTEDALAVADAGSAETYYDVYGTSYEYNYWMNEFYGVSKIHGPNSTFRQVLGDSENRGITADKFRIFNDMSYFHGKKGTYGNMNFLFADWHVADLAGSSSARNVHGGGK
jgi:prepilin-type N-terminal cleavage/methylation domain-containing protein/prepilin-type processing-associated H-X9-DG protein